LSRIVAAIAACIALLTAGSEAAWAQVQQPAQANAADAGGFDVLDRMIDTNRMVILDYSGSMKILGMPRERQIYPLALEAAIKLSGSVERVDPEGKSGLIVFGHTKGPKGSNGVTREESCRDFSVEFPYEKMTPERARTLQSLNGRLRNVEPGGETPLRDTVELAATTMGEGGAIILLTDLDRDTCEGTNDPCAEIEAMRRVYAKSHIHLTHIVAIRARDQSVAGAERLAACTNARFYVLDRDIDGMVAQVNRDLAAAASPATLRVDVRFLTEPAITPQSGAGHAAIRIEDATASRELPLLGSQLLDIAPGSIRASGRIGAETVVAEIASARRGQANAVEMLFRPSEVTVTLNGPEGAALPDATAVTWTVSGAGQSRSQEGGATLSFHALSFPHEVTAQIPGYSAHARIVPAAPGSVVTKGLTLLPTGGGVAATIRTSLAFPNGALYSENLDPLSVVLSGNGADVELPANGAVSAIPPGTYEVFVAYPDDRLPLGRVEMKAGRELSISGSLASAAVVLTTTLPLDEDALWSISNSTGLKKVFSGKLFRQIVVPGSYRVTVESRQGKATTDIQVSPAGGTVVGELTLR